jgi:acyl carrier protein
MASRRGVVERMQAQGWGVIEPEEGLTILEHLLSLDAAQVGVLPIHCSALLDNFRGRSEMRLLERLCHETLEPPKTAGPVHQDSVFSQQLIKAPAAKRRNLLQDMIQGEAARALGLPPTEQIDAYQPLTELGLDSLMAVQLRNALSSLVDRPLPATLLFNCPSVDQLVSYLEGALQSSQEDQGAPMPGANETCRSAARDESAGEGLDKLSEEEMVHLLASKLKEL